MIDTATVVVLLASYRFIQHGDRERHRIGMLIAAALGAAFLAVYLTYHFSAGLAKFGGYGPILPIYFTLLAVHVLMASAAGSIRPSQASALEGTHGARSRLSGLRATRSARATLTSPSR